MKSSKVVCKGFYLNAAGEGFALCNILRYFTAVKTDNFQMKNCDIFLIFAQNINCGYKLEQPQ